MPERPADLSCPLPAPPDFSTVEIFMLRIDIADGRFVLFFREIDS